MRRKFVNCCTPEQVGTKECDENDEKNPEYKRLGPLVKLDELLEFEPVSCALVCLCGA